MILTIDDYKIYQFSLRYIWLDKLFYNGMCNIIEIYQFMLMKWLVFHNIVVIEIKDSLYQINYLNSCFY